MVDRTRLLRSEIEQIVGGDHKLVRAYEELQRAVIEDLPELIEDAELSLESLDARVDVVEDALTDGAVLVKDEGVGAGADTHTLNFVGDGVTAAVAAGVATVTILGGGITFSGAKARKAATLTAQNLTAGPSVTWDTEDWDTDSFHDASSNTDRFTVPAAGIYFGRAYLRLENILSANYIDVQLNRYNSAGVLQEAMGRHMTEISASGTHHVMVTGSGNFSSGDFMRVSVAVETDTSVDISSLSYGEIWRVS